MTREAVLDLENELKQQNEGHVLCPSAHHFAGISEGKGIYARETFLPEGSIVVGKIHKYSTINFLTLGVVKVFNPEQPELDKIMVAPYTWVSPAGSKRAVHAIRDSLWATVHPAASQDLGELEEQLIVKTYDELTLDEKRSIGDLKA